jgi:hypothetical protein
MTHYSQALGYVTEIRGYDLENPEALQFVLVESGHSPAPQWNGPSFTFTLRDVVQNRQLVWVSLIRDALAHTLPVEVSYSYEAPSDPGSGKVTSIVVSSDPFGIDPQQNQYWAVKTASGLVSSLSVNQFRVAYGEDFVGGHPGRMIVELHLDSGGDATFVLGLAKPDREVREAQLRTLVHAQKCGLRVTLTYEELLQPIDFPLEVIGVTVHSNHA